MDLLSIFKSKDELKDSSFISSTRFLLVAGFLTLIMWFSKGILTDHVLIICATTVVVVYLVVNSWTKIEIAKLNKDLKKK